MRSSLTSSRESELSELLMMTSVLGSSSGLKYKTTNVHRLKTSGENISSLNTKVVKAGRVNCVEPRHCGSSHCCSTFTSKVAARSVHRVGRLVCSGRGGNHLRPEESCDGLKLQRFELNKTKCCYADDRQVFDEAAGTGSKVITPSLYSV